MSTRTRLGELTWVEVADRVASGRRTVVLPTGSVEQHGPHLPLLTDSIIADGIAAELCARLDAVATPAVFTGVSPHHLAFPGTLTLSPATFLDTVDAMVDGLARAGLTEILLFSAHGGNVPVLRDASDHLDRTARAHGGQVRVIGSTETFADCFQTVLAGFGLSTVALPHAEVAETSLIAGLCPDLYRAELAEAGARDLPTLAEVLGGNLRDISPNGVLGDPAGASAAIGFALLDALAGSLVAELDSRR